MNGHEKKNPDNSFILSMDLYNSIKINDLVGLYLLNKIHSNKILT